MNNHRDNLLEFEDFIKRFRFVPSEKVPDSMSPGWIGFSNILSIGLPNLWIKSFLQSHLLRIKQMHDQDLEEGYGTTTLPDSLEEKYPNANKEWTRQLVFPSKSLVVHPETGKLLRRHIQPGSLQRKIKEAVRKSDISKQVSCQVLRHSFAMHLLEAGHNIRTIQELM